MVNSSFLVQKRGSFRLLAAFVAFFVGLSFVGFFACGRACESDSERVAEMLEEGLEERLRTGFFSFSEAIELAELKVSAAELCACFSELKMCEPYLFFVSGEISYACDAEGFVLSVTPKYTMSRESIVTAKSYCEKRISEICSMAEEYEGELAKCLFVYDYFCGNFKYDYEYQSEDIYNFFLSGRGTCRAFSLAFSAVLGKLGIETAYASSDEMGHMWNLVQLNGEWYHCDVAWGACLFSEGGKDHRLHFLFSDAAAIEYGHRNYTTFRGISCPSRLYDGVFLQ